MRGLTPLRYLLPGLLLVIALACGSGDSDALSDAAPVAEVGDKLFGGSLITNPDGHYSVDDLVTVGYKKSKQFPTDSLRSAQEVWYGFFNQRDIEVWVYESHEQALEFGLEPAEAAIVEDLDQYLGLSVVARYTAYAVVGNLVMLCQLELETCEALISELD